jgi:dipeptidyl aminopeptidase/acylaminoacyl peptidase
MQLRNVVGVLLALVLVLITAQQRTPFNVHHLHSMKRVGMPAVDPKGKFAVYTVRVWNESTKKSNTNLDIINLADNSIRQLTAGPGDSSPVFSPDGSYVAFSRKGQIYTVPTSGSESDVQQLTNLPVDIGNLKFAPNGKFIAFSADVYYDCETLECTAKRDEAIAARGANTGFIYDSLYVRHWDTWLMPGKVSHVFILPVALTQAGKVVAGTPVDMMLRFNANSPVPPFGGAEQFDISPDGTEMALTVEVMARNVSWTTGWKIFTVNVENPSQKTLITGFTSARTQQPTYSPDGRYIAFLAMDRPGLESDKLSIWLYDRSQKSVKPISRSVDISFQSITWYPTGDKFVSDADSFGHHKLYQVGLDASFSELISTGHSAGAVFIPGTNQLLISRDSYTAPADIYRLNSDGTGLQQLTNYNADILNQIAISTPSLFQYSGRNGTVQGWYWPPVNAQEGKRYPMVTLIHGGPEGSWSSAWSYRWNPALWAAHGYAVIAINPHGSTGYGQAFTDAVRGNWGGLPYQDIMDGVEYAARTFPTVDGDRVVACGASYGGYMINWINSQTNRFKALVCHDGVFDAVAMGYETEELWFTEAEFGGTPYNNPQGYEQWNPRRFVKNMNTPQLIIHGGKDYRIPITEGLSIFTALQRRNIPSKLLYLPEENHWVLNPANSIMWYDTVLSWLDQWTGHVPPQ